jgi:hypothetical protein
MSEALLSTQNTGEAEALVREAWNHKFPPPVDYDPELVLAGREPAPQFVFEHGHWWVIEPTDEGTRTWDVVDARPGAHPDIELDFEEC